MSADISGGPHSLPPTEDDRKLSTRHHVDSVSYNLKHSSDHFKSIPKHLKLMQKVAGEKAAAAQAKRAARVLEKMQAELAPYLSKGSKPEKK